MPRFPWKSLAAPENNKEYLALLTYLPLKHYRMVPKFFWLSFETQRQLRTSKGLIGYSLDTQTLRLRFWTLSVWENQQSLTDFVRQAPHGRIMQTLAPHMGKTQFVQWNVTAQDISPDWRDARARMS
jgi:hypothetical protein